MTTRVIAAIDDSQSATGVLAVADTVASMLFNGEVEALHVGDGSAGPVLRAVDEAGVSLRIETGPTEATIAEAVRAPDVVAIVLGSRSTPAGPRPAGHTALRIMTSVEKPLFAVPPELALPYVLDKVLVPLDASASTAAAVRETLLLGWNCGLDIVVLHVHAVDSLPMFNDHAHHESRAWIDEFVARNCPQSVEVAVELRIGEVHDQVMRVARDTGADLIVLGWAQDLSPGHANTVRETMKSSNVPVLLLPRTTRSWVMENVEGNIIHLEPASAGPARI